MIPQEIVAGLVNNKKQVQLLQVSQEILSWLVGSTND